MAATNFIVRVSSMCNLRCHYCFAWHDLKNRKMSKKMLERVIREIDSLGLPSAQMSWHGGEPLLLGLELFEYGIELQSSLKTQFYNTVQTNGVLVDDAYADFFAKNHFGVGISLDGYKEAQDKNRPFRSGKGSFDKAIKGLERLQNRGLEVSCISVISDFCEPNRYFEFIKSMSFSDFSMKPCSGDWEHSMSLAEYTEFIKKVHRLIASDEDVPNCRDFMGYAENIISGKNVANLCLQSGNCGNFTMIDVDGDVYPCDELTSDEFRWGNIAEKPLNQILASGERQRFLDRVRRQNESCKEGCEAFDACLGGCTSCHLYFKEDEYCNSLRTTIGEIRRMVTEGVESWLDPEDESVKKLVDPKLLGKF